MTYEHTFTIEETKWMHGSKNADQNNAKLFRSSDSRMCCLGFFALSCGLTVADIKNIARPDEVPVELPVMFAKALGLDEVASCGRTSACEASENYELMTELIRLNDDKGFTLEERKTAIQETFAKVGVEVLYTNSKAAQ